MTRDPVHAPLLPMYDAAKQGALDNLSPDVLMAAFWLGYRQGHLERHSIDRYARLPRDPKEPTQ